MIDSSLIDYRKCHEYARSLCGQYGIPLCEAEDIGSEAYLLAVRRTWRAGEVENAEAVGNRLVYTSVLNVIDRRNTLANKMIREADEINSDSSEAALTLRSDDDEAEEPRSCEAVARAPAIGVESLDDDWQNPFWLRLFNLERKKLRREKSKSPVAKLSLSVIKAGLKDSRLSVIKADLKISGSKFCAILDLLKVRFDLSFRALRALQTSF